MAGATKLLTAGGGGVILTPDSSIASDVTVNVPSSNGTAVVTSSAVSAAGQIPFSTDGSTFTPTAKIVAGTSVTASGTTINFTSIPSWVKRITVMLDGVSTNGAGGVAFRLGTSGGVETTGYVTGSSRTAASSVSGAAYATAFVIVNDSASYAISGSIVFTLLNQSTNTWVATGAFGSLTTIFNYFTAGSKSLSGTLDRVQILTANFVDTFDAGSINILYE